MTNEKSKKEIKIDLNLLENLYENIDNVQMKLVEYEAQIAAYQGLLDFYQKVIRDIIKKSEQEKCEEA